MVCINIDHMQYVIDEVISDDGEGVMLRYPGSVYVNGRADTVIKIKVRLYLFV